MENFSENYFEGGFGIERETLRLDDDGRLSKSMHPFDNPHLQRDFCENQLEIITGVNSSVKDAVAEWDSYARKNFPKMAKHCTFIQIRRIFLICLKLS